MPSAVATGLEPRRHVHRRTFVDDVRHDGTEALGRAIARWVVANGGDAAWTLDGLLVKTQVKWARVPEGYWVGKGYIGQFWVISNEVHAGCYDPADTPSYLAVVDRDTAAAMVVAADEAVEVATTSDDVSGRAYGVIEQLRTYVHQLAATAEALR